MKNPKLFIANPSRSNFCDEVRQRPSDIRKGNVDQFEELLPHTAEELITKTVNVLVTIVYSSLELCATKAITSSTEKKVLEFLRKDFCQFHSLQTDKINSKIIYRIFPESFTQRVIFATYSCIWMGRDSPCVERIIHFGVPHTMESGRTGRDERPSQSIWYFDNSDIGAIVEGLQRVMREYYKNPKNECRKKMLRHFGFGIPECREKLYSCCDVC